MLNSIFHKLYEKSEKCDKILRKGEQMRLTHVAANCSSVTVFLGLDCVVWNTN